MLLLSPQHAHSDPRVFVLSGPPTWSTLPSSSVTFLATWPPPPCPSFPAWPLRNPLPSVCICCLTQCLEHHDLFMLQASMWAGRAHPRQHGPAGSSCCLFSSTLGQLAPCVSRYLPRPPLLLALGSAQWTVSGGDWQAGPDTQDFLGLLSGQAPGLS